MLIKQIYRVLLLALLGLASCTDDDGVGTVQRVDLLDFEFPQGNDPWDSDIEQSKLFIRRYDTENHYPIICTW